MKTPHVPVTLGSPRSRRVETESLEVVAAWFPSHARLGTHTHPRALFGVMLDGAFRTSILGREVDYEGASVWTEPAEERHANVASAVGARVLIIQPARAASSVAAIHRDLFDEVVHERSIDLRTAAMRLEAECAVRDDLAPLVVEGLGLALLARAARLFRRARHHDAHPAWLEQARDYLHAHCLERVQLGAVARAVGVHPSRLSHEFRTRLHVSPGEFVRALRLSWAAVELRKPESTIADVAARAGFYDQSHFSRLFRRQFGVAPAAWRREPSSQH
ncbi:MAG: helix-turn-helix transcriptional regulator [Cytophagaceae bacterium]|nr:helix-turn-helix transcriptional regulator [Gemmatimonadaceae bacterium]